jgi:hypothetical protein
MHENDDGAAFDRVGSNGGAPGGQRPTYTIGCVRLRGAPHPTAAVATREPSLSGACHVVDAGQRTP